MQNQKTTQTKKQIILEYEAAQARTGFKISFLTVIIKMI